jgi:dihydroorotase
MDKLYIKKGHLLDPATGLNKTGDMYIADGHIISIDKKPDGFKADQTIDATHLTVIPGIIDLCARLREPGQEHKSTINSETIAAASAGITTLCYPPDTDPVIDEPAVVELINHKTSNAAHSKVIMLGALTAGLKGERLSEMYALKTAGCVGVSNCRHPVDNTLTLKKAYSYASNCGLTVFIEPEDHWLSKGGCAHEGAIASRLGLKGIPVSAETTAVARALALVAETGVKAHLGRLSSASGVEMIRRAKADGMTITADVSAHQLHLSETDISSLNSAYHLLPPLRAQRDQEALHKGIADGTIDAISSDHQPHEPDAKQSPFASTLPGISALETLLPLTLKLVEKQILDIETAVRAITSSPASILNITAGTLAAGTTADICIIDKAASWTLEQSNILSQGKNTPFSGWDFQGKAKHTIIDGVLIYSNTN